MAAVAEASKPQDVGRGRGMGEEKQGPRVD